MVLQQESHVNIWGKAKKNQELIIYTSWSGKIIRTIVKDDGSWEVKIKTPSAGGPYNIQVNYLISILPKGARVGTIDKFQGQEAPAT